jgi:Ca-activated chloride channel family protein
MYLRDPWWLLLGLLLPLVVFFFLRRKHFGSVRFPSLRHFKRSSGSLRILLLPVLPVLRVAALALLIFALARPQLGTESQQDFSRGVAIMMALDISGSMQAKDFELDDTRATRIDAVKRVFRAFVLGDDKAFGNSLPGRPYDEIGIVAFGGFAISRAPLTLDHAALADLLAQIQIPKQIVDERGRPLNAEELRTSIGDGLALSVARLRDSIAKAKMIILLSDGVHNTGDVTPEQAARAAKEFGIKVYTIGIGTNGYAPVEVEDPFTGQRMLRSMPVEFDPKTLKDIAETTGGRYFHATSTDALERIYAEIDRMEKTDIQSRVFMRFEERFHWYLLAAFALLILEQLLAHTYLRRIP